MQPSAISGAANIRTPTLITHGGADRVCPTSQARELYRALSRRRGRSRLVDFLETLGAVVGLDNQVTRNRLDLSPEAWRGLLDGRRTDVPDIERGHVALGLETPGGSHVVGWGFVREGRLKEHIPRGRRKWLRNVVAE